MKITEKKLRSIGACDPGIEWFNNLELNDPKEILSAADTVEKLEYCNWAIVRLLSKKLRIDYAVFAAEQVLHIFEEKYPDDKRPREAIEAAKSGKNTAASYAAYAAEAAYAANADAYDTAASYAASYAAYAAAANAYDAAAAYAVYAAEAAAAYAVYAAEAAAADEAARGEMYRKILAYGITLLK
jgi:hypothetical protein